jgi:hypothetical protein
MKLDLHIHSFFSSDGHMDVKTIVQRAKVLGLDGIAVTDHNSMEASAKFGDFKGSGLLLVPGMEVSSDSGHILAYGITTPIPRELTIEDTIDRIKAAGGVAVASHPYRKVTGLGEDNIIRGRFRHIEGFNGRTRPAGNRKAVILAKRIGANITGGSDAHLPEEIGNAFTLVPDNVGSVEELVEAIFKGLTDAGGAQPGLKKYVGAASGNVVRWVKRGGHKL